jgi:hypothetical protein
MRKEYDFSKGKRGAIVPPDPRKTRITIRIDTKILNWFRQRVHEAGGGNYQTMINEALKSYIESDNSETVRYPGGPHVDLDEKLRTIMEAAGRKLQGGGYNRKDNIRDLKFIKEKAA